MRYLAAGSRKSLAISADGQGDAPTAGGARQRHGGAIVLGAALALIDQVRNDPVQAGITAGANRQATARRRPGPILHPTRQRLYLVLRTITDAARFQPYAALSAASVRSAPFEHATPTRTSRMP
jgi:hypothetical protein